MLPDGKYACNPLKGEVNYCFNPLFASSINFCDKITASGQMYLNMDSRSNTMLRLDYCGKLNRGPEMTNGLRDISGCHYTGNGRILLLVKWNVDWTCFITMEHTVTHMWTMVWSLYALGHISLTFCMIYNIICKHTHVRVQLRWDISWIFFSLSVII